MRPHHWLPTSVAILVVGAIIFGCGGSGGGVKSTTATSTTASTTGAATATATATGSTTATSTATTATGSTSGNATGLILTTNPNPGQITPQVVSCMVTLTDNTPADPNKTYTWSVEAPDGPPGTFFLAPPGQEGTLMTTDGQPFPTGPTTLTQAVYVGNPAQLVFGTTDYVNVSMTTSKGFYSYQPFVPISLNSNYTTLPPAIGSGVASMTLDQPLYKPGGIITAHIHVIPGLNNGVGCAVNASGFTPSAATLNGTATTLPVTFTYNSNTPAFDAVVTLTIPASQYNEFPVDNTSGTISGSWVELYSEANPAWTVLNPLFIHN